LEPAVFAALEVTVDNIGDRFLELIHDLEDIANSVTAQRALADFDETTLQVFWKKWPHLSAWSGRLWAMLSAELATASAQAVDAELDETGGSG
jgi:hypothetical protein